MFVLLMTFYRQTRTTQVTILPGVLSPTPNMIINSTNPDQGFVLGVDVHDKGRRFGRQYNGSNIFVDFSVEPDMRYQMNTSTFIQVEITPHRREMNTYQRSFRFKLHPQSSETRILTEFGKEYSDTIRYTMYSLIKLKRIWIREHISMYRVRWDWFCKHLYRCYYEFIEYETKITQIADPKEETTLPQKAGFILQLESEYITVITNYYAFDLITLFIYATSAATGSLAIMGFASMIYRYCILKRWMCCCAMCCCKYPPHHLE
jgi:hypothetical protein